MMASRTNCTETVQPASEILYATNIALSVISAVIGLFAVGLNSLVLASVVKTPSLQRPANLWLCSLSISDLLVGLVVIPLYATVRLLMITHNTSICLVTTVWKICKIILLLSLGGATFQLCLITWDRYKAVSNPLVYRATVSKRKILISIATSWLAWITLVVILKFPVPEPYSSYIISAIGISLLPFPIIGQAATYKSILRHNQQIVAADSQTTAIALAREKKGATTFFYVTFATFGCHIVPAVFYAVVLVTKFEGFAEYAELLPFLVGFLNSCINLVIYFWRHPDMRGAVRSLVGRWCLCKQGQQQ